MAFNLGRGSVLGAAVLDLRTDASKLDKGLDQAERNTKQSTARMSKAWGAVGVGIGIAAVAAGAIAVDSIKFAANFDKAVREVATLTPVIADNLDQVKRQVRELSVSLGTDAVGGAQALYQAISAGVPPENALTFLETASKAAIGGVTDTETAVNGLTTVVNAFAVQNVSAEQAADVMFETVKRGKTTFEELSAYMFQIAPLAAATGVSFEEVSAAIATLTAQGTPTSVAATQIRPPSSA